MNNEKILKKKIQQYLLMPLALTVLLVGMVIVLYVHDKKSGAIAAAAVFIFVVCEIIFFIVMKAAIMPVVFRFALEQGQIQKELLKELDIPYALLDTDGKILWGNAKFIEEIGVGSKKRIRKNISAFFPAVDAEALSSEEMQMDLEYNDRVYRALLRRIDFSEALVDSDEDAMVDHQADAMITLYLYDETELRIYKKENEDQKLVAGLLYIDNYDEVMEKYDDMMTWLAELYVNTLNIIHYMHDKYCYESLQMALHDRDVKRYFATGIAGLSVVADSLSAIKYGKVKVIRKDIEVKNKKGEVLSVAKDVAVDYVTEGDFPKYGNNDDRVDEIAVDIVKRFMNKVRQQHCYRGGVPTTSILTITSNVVYGKNTGSTPDGRKIGVPLAPGANPMHGRDTHGASSSLSSVSKLPFTEAQDGISNTFSIIPDALGKDDKVFMGDLDIDALATYH